MPVERRGPAVDRRHTRRGGRRDSDHSGRPIVLIVDDHADSRELTAAVLESVGMAIAEAATGRDALRRVGAHPPVRLVLIDLALPDCHGTDVVKALKADDVTRDIPVVALSASVMSADKERASEAGCVAFIEKPIVPDHMAAVVRRLLGDPTS